MYIEVACLLRFTINYVHQEIVLKYWLSRYESHVFSTFNSQHDSRSVFIHCLRRSYKLHLQCRYNDHDDCEHEMMNEKIHIMERCADFAVCLQTTNM